MLTLNVDEEPEAARRYAENNSLSVPVLLAHDYVRGTLGVRGIPRNWVLDRQLVWREDEIGFSGADGWIDEMSAALASAGNGAGAGGGR